MSAQASKMTVTKCGMIVPDQDPSSLLLADSNWFARRSFDGAEIALALARIVAYTSRQQRTACDRNRLGQKRFR
jgi:hypothetical protein